ncbi:MAG: AraC family transcriptional regulator [Oscillospiraceae bacterium]|nr:AraC family transcriptional regulator [Oscillospiraceae bacterium]
MNDIVFYSNDDVFSIANYTTVVQVVPHYHSEFEIYYLLKGNCRYLIDKSIYELSEGDLCIIPPGTIHNTRYEKEDNHKRMLISFPENYLPDSLREAISKIYFHPNSKITQSKIKEIFDSIDDEYTHPDHFSKYAIQNKIHELILLILRNDISADSPTSESLLVKQAITFIKGNYASNITAEQTAKFCFVSREHLTRTLKRETGFSFKEFLTFYRLKKAEAILKSNPKERIIDVALQCGFNDSNYFSKVYKQKYSCSPSAVKKSNQHPIL